MDIRYEAIGSTYRGNMFGLRSPGAEGFTIADLHAMPGDSLRHELIDGSIIVSPSGTAAHNMIAWWIARAVEDAYPSNDHFASADQSTTVDDHNEPRPDIVVAAAEHFLTTPFP